MGEKINKRKVGNEYERLAAKYLQEKGYKIRCMNFYAGKTGEIDIVAENFEGALIFVECKYRKNNNCGDAFEAVNYLKQKQICKSSLVYYMKNGYSMDYPCRYDVISIDGKGNIQHIENAFDFV